MARSGYFPRIRYQTDSFTALGVFGEGSCDKEWVLGTFRKGACATLSRRDRAVRLLAEWRICYQFVLLMDRPMLSTYLRLGENIFCLSLFSVSRMTDVVEKSDLFVQVFGAA